MRGRGSASAEIAELVSSGAGVLAVCSDASRQAGLAAGATGLARFNGGAGRIACARCGAVALQQVAGRGPGGLGLVDYATLERAPELIDGFEHVVLVGSPPPAATEQAAARGWVGSEAEQGAPGFLHAAWTEAENGFALAVSDEQHASRAAVAAVFRALRTAGTAGGEQLRDALGGSAAHPLPPEAAARCFRVLSELGLVSGEPNGGAGSVGVVSSEGTDLERSAAFRAYRADHSEVQRYLEKPK